MMYTLLMYFIYRTVNLITGKFYIGQHKTSRLNDSYLGSGKLLKAAITKYGREAFRREILEILPDQASLDLAEADWITPHLTNPKCYNLTLGGRNWSHINQSETIKAKMRKAVQDKYDSDPEFKARQAENARRVARDPLLIEKSRRTREANGTLRRGNPGYKHTPETKAKISASLQRAKG